MVYNSFDDAHMGLATGDDAGAGAGLTAWRNADAAYVAGELIPADIPLSYYVKLPIVREKQIGAMTTSMVNKTIPVGRSPGMWKSRHAFQTCQFSWWIMQTAGTPTVENTPTGYNTHTITISTSNVPLWHGIHFERESIASNPLRYDLMGLLPERLTISCSSTGDLYSAVQDIEIPFAYANVAASDIAAQTERPSMTLGTLWKDWNHLVIGGGAGEEPTGFTYNTATLELDIVNIRFVLERAYSWGAVDVNGYYTSGKLGSFNYKILMDVYPTGDLLYTLNRTAKASYAGDLDYNASFTADATNDKITLNFDKLYMVPFDEENDLNKWNETYSIELIPYDTTSSLTITGIDGLDNTHFENP